MGIVVGEAHGDSFTFVGDLLSFLTKGQDGNIKRGGGNAVDVLNLEDIERQGITNCNWNRAFRGSAEYFERDEGVVSGEWCGGCRGDGGGEDDGLASEVDGSGGGFVVGCTF